MGGCIFYIEIQKLMLDFRLLLIKTRGYKKMDVVVA